MTVVKNTTVISYETNLKPYCFVRLLFVQVSYRYHYRTVIHGLTYPCTLWWRKSRFETYLV